MRLLAAHSRNCVDLVDHLRISFGVMPAMSAIPVDGSTGAHSIPTDRCSSRRSVAW